MVNLITEHIDIWTAAQTQKTNGGRGRGKNFYGQSAHGIRKLRELVLELAARGQLVPQDPNDEPASVLLEKIEKEKARFVKEGKIKKQKPLPEITDDEKPFELPHGWKWVRFREISEYIQRGKGPKYANIGKVRVVSQKCVQWSGFNLEPAKYIDDTSLEAYQGERFLQTNDLLLNSTGTGTVGRINILRAIEPKTLVTDSHVTIVRTLLVDSGFIWSYIAAPSIQSRMEPTHDKALVSGTTNQVELNTSAVVQLEIPIPPAKEQHRIVAKVDELMALCDQLEQQQTDSNGTHQTLVETLLTTLTNATDQDEFTETWQRIAEYFDILFTTENSIEQLKQTILQLAVMGKLVPQDPNDEPASVLLKKITEEKAWLIKEGKIKKEKLLTEISEEEKPFELPEGWEWIRLGSAGLCSTGKTPSTRNPKYYNGEIPFIGPGQISQDGDITESDKTLTEKGSEYSVIAESGDILMVCIGGSIGKSAVAQSKVAFNQQINCINPLKVDSLYLNVAMNTRYFQASIINSATGSATPIINRSKWEELLSRCQEVC